MNIIRYCSTVIFLALTAACATSAEKVEGNTENAPGVSYCQPNTHEARIIEVQILNETNATWRRAGNKKSQSKSQNSKIKEASLVCSDNDAFYASAQGVPGTAASAVTSPLVEELSIYPGDTLVLVNEFPIHSPKDAQQAMKEAESRNETRILLIRNSRPLEIRYKTN